MKKNTWKLDIARAGYQNCTCEEERFKNPLRGECRCIAPLMLHITNIDVRLDISGFKYSHFQWTQLSCFNALRFLMLLIEMRAIVSANVEIYNYFYLIVEGSIYRFQ